MQPTAQLKYLFTLTALILCRLVSAQNGLTGPEQDCSGAIPISYPYYNYHYNGYSGIGNGPDEVDSVATCLKKGERNSLWLKVCIGANGTLQFNICPDDNQDNYDWAVYNGTYAGCSYFHSDSLLVSCNYSASTFPSSCTGANDGDVPQDNTVINVFEAETYFIVINHEGINGFTIDFTGTLLGTSCITAIEEKSYNVAPALYPNPANNSITINLTYIKQGQTGNIKIYNALGVLVKQVNNIVQQQTTIDIATLSNGLYYYVIDTPAGQKTDKFVKQ